MSTPSNPSFSFGQPFTTASAAVAPISAAPTTSTAPLIKDTTTQAFRQDVLVESKNQPVLVDFWAPWCEPCKQLEPTLKKVVEASKGKVKLVKLNIDEHPAIAGQLGIRSIPAVLAFDHGKPVDGFMGNVPESQLQAFIDELTGGDMSAQVNEVLKEADNLLNAGDLTQAAQLYANVLMEDNQNLHAIGAMIRIQVMLGEHESAKRYLAMVPEAKHSYPAIASARATLDLAEQSANIGELTALEEVVNKNPLDHQARFDLALALAAKNRKDEAIDHLLIIVKKDRTWNEDGARKQVIQFFDAWGAMDEATLTGRRKLSTALFS